MRDTHTAALPGILGRKAGGELVVELPEEVLDARWMEERVARRRSKALGMLVMIVSGTGACIAAALTL